MLRPLAFLIALTASSALAAPLIELTTSGQAVQGRQLASNKKVCWLVDVDGCLIRVPLETVTAFRQVDPEFKPRPMMEVKKRLAKELGSEFDIAVRGRYVVAAPRGRADEFAGLFDQTSREFLQYLRVRRFRIVEPDLPLVAVVFPSRRQFVAQCARDDVNPGPALRGYYDQHSNRVMLYEDPLEDTLAASSAESGQAAAGSGNSRETRSARKSFEARSGAADSSSMARETAVHEAIHQLAFNTGLHSRIGTNPLWVVEGLAMQFERGEGGFLKTRTAQRVNVPRLESFDAYRKEGRQSGALAKMISGDEVFRKTALGAYGDAWLFTNYLLETRPQKFGWFLQTLAARNPLDPYPPEERLKDFQANFDEDLAWLEIEYLRYAEKLAGEALGPAASGKR